MGQIRHSHDAPQALAKVLQWLKVGKKTTNRCVLKREAWGKYPSASMCFQGTSWNDAECGRITTWPCLPYLYLRQRNNKEDFLGWHGIFVGVLVQVNCLNISCLQILVRLVEPPSWKNMIKLDHPTTDDAINIFELPPLPPPAMLHLAVLVPCELHLFHEHPTNVHQLWRKSHEGKPGVSHM